ncbi:MAG: hypothetical protein ACRCW1_01675 [Anaerotignaceae bacterium]
MPNTFPAYSQGAVAGASTNRQLLNDLNIFDRSFEKNLVRKYGAENYAIVQMALGNSVMEAKSDNRLFYHYEKRGLHQAVSVKAAVVAPVAGANVTVTIGSSSATTFANDPSYYSSSLPLRPGEVVRIMTSGIEGQVVSVSTGAYPLTAVIRPLVSTQAFVSAGSANLLASDFLMLRGAVNIGEGSTVLNGMSPILDKIENTTTEHRDDFTITDRAAIEKNEVDFGNGNQYYYYLAQDDMNRRYMNNAFFKIMEGVAVDNITGTVGTTGVIPRIAANGTTIQYTSGQFGGVSGTDMSNMQAITRSLNFYGGSGEYHFLQDIFQRQDVSNLLFGKYNNGAISYGSVGGSQEAAVSYGFSSFMIDGYTFHFYLNNMFSPESVYHINPGALVPEKRNYGVLIPQKINSDAKTGKQFPSFQIVFQEVNGQRILTTETGMLAPQNKTTTANKTISMLSYPGVRTFAANQYCIVEGI